MFQSLIIHVPHLRYVVISVRGKEYCRQVIFMNRNKIPTRNLQNRCLYFSKSAGAIRVFVSKRTIPQISSVTHPAGTCLPINTGLAFFRQNIRCQLKQTTVAAKLFQDIKAGRQAIFSFVSAVTKSAFHVAGGHGSPAYIPTFHRIHLTSLGPSKFSSHMKHISNRIDYKSGSNFLYRLQQMRIDFLLAGALSRANATSE